ncbi:glycosyltransferase family 9 protein [Oligosphaera ethanolica]|uniref:Lipopolysaccharide heptosyltransferase I n=1 Tax=Oligosphaera ethanolica TaxID=760260 RepID=A0AAE3VG85_9BACT|nr:glycosyltransferase family 9 protein [Oligosphaera ethanolica]MDQ0289907.1 lipopolysaccharide heptosyltransferase I [Oligosphaera ethanolica]
MRILVVKPSSLGDVIHTFPAVDLIRRSLPEAPRITWVVNDKLAAITALCPGIDRVVKFPRHQLASARALRNFVKDLQAEPYDLAIDFQGLLRSGIISRLSKAPRRAGFKHAREGAWLFYTEKYSVPADIRHAVAKNLSLVRQVLPSDAPERRPPLAIPSAQRAEASALLTKLHGTGPILAVGFSSRWPSKNWPLAFFAAVLDECARRQPGLRCWLLGAPNEQADGEKLRAMTIICQPTNLAGSTAVLTLAALLEQSQALLTNDSGPMHIAAALGLPCVALFGATDPTLTGPYGEEGLHQIIHSQCPNSPCFQRVCPTSPGECCKGWDPAAVADTIITKLQRHT